MKKKNFWKEGGFVDLWSFNHVIAGALFGGTFYYLDIFLWKTMFVGISLMIIWEFYETLHGIKEAFLNRVTDVIIGALGLFGFFVISTKIETIFSALAFLVLLIIWVTLQKRGYTYLNKEHNAKK